MEAGEYGLTRETCFVARRLDAVAVAGLLWTSWRVLGAAGFFGGVFSFFFQAEDGIRDQPRSRGLGDVYKRQPLITPGVKRRVGTDPNPSPKSSEE